MRPSCTIGLSFLLVNLLTLPIAQAGDPVVIVRPNDDAVVPPTFTVQITYGEVDWCEEGICTLAGAEKVRLVHVSAEETEELAECYPCSSEFAEFKIKLAPGQHSLRATASFRSSYEYSEQITITVDENAPPEDGCGCATTENGGAHATAWLTLIWLSVHRRRRTDPPS